MALSTGITRAGRIFQPVILVQRGIAELARCIAKGVDFEFAHGLVGEFAKEPVDDGGCFDAALGVGDQDDFLGRVGFEGCAELGAALSDVAGFVVEIALDEAFDEVEDEAFSGGC